MPVIDSQTARELAAKSHEARRRNKELRMLPEPDPQPIPQIAQPDSKQEELSRTLRQIEELNEQLDQCDDFKAWDALTRAKERLFRIWAHLAGIPGPGNLKPSQAKSKRPEPLPEPTPCVPNQVPQPSPPAQPGPS